MNNHRKINWLSCLDQRNYDRISFLEKKLSGFYFGNPDYYADIDFTADNWLNENEVGYRDILNVVKNAEQILEVGCGSANILKSNPGLQSKYNGCDFSEKLINSNSQKYPAAKFKCFSKPNVLPYDNAKFDVVFSVFVLEHSSNPPLFLKECVRTLKVGGILIILCPDYLSYGRMTSQRAGFSQGTARNKLQQGKYFDAVVTLFDNRVKIPLYCKYFSFRSLNTPKFYINVNPTVFTDSFVHDADAVYVTSKSEIIKYLKELKLLPNTPQLKKYEETRRIIYLKFIK